MTKLDLTVAESKTAREALRAYATNLDTQLRNVKMTRAAELDTAERRNDAYALLERIPAPAPKPAPKPRKPRKPAAGK